MDEEKIEQGELLANTIRAQLDTLLAVFSRPVVQRQILAIALILVVAWLLTRFIRRWLKQDDPAQQQPDSQPRWRRWMAGLGQLIAPVVTLVLLNVTIWLFESQGFPNGLLADTASLFWIWLIYSALLAVLYARFGEAMRPYHRRLLMPILFILVFWQALRIIPGFVAFGSVPFGFGSLSVTLVDFLEAMVVLYLFFVVAWIVELLLNQNLPERLQADPGVIQSVAALTRYVISGLGILVAFGVLGLDATSLALVAGGLSVGIGIGLQDIVANFVSGLVLLFEQSLRPGDVIELGGNISQVEKISLRTTTVRTLNNEEVIIPNASFTTGAVTTLTKTERLVRIMIPLGVSYDSDPRQVRQVIEETAAEHPLVLSDPAPVLFFRGFGDSSLDFELAVWIDQPERTLVVKSDLYYALWSALAEQGIEIPFPQRDLNLGDGWEKLATA